VTRDKQTIEFFYIAGLPHTTETWMGITYLRRQGIRPRRFEVWRAKDLGCDENRKVNNNEEWEEERKISWRRWRWKKGDRLTYLTEGGPVSIK